jgi:prevent-host-death family protein
VLTWQVQEAKNKFSELIERAGHGEPQVITKHGAEVAVLISIGQYKERFAPEQSLVEFLLNSPLADSGLVVTRDQGADRPPVDL